MANNILFICYWSSNDNLTVATVLPRLRLLQQCPDVEKVVYLTIERERSDLKEPDYLSDIPKVDHKPYFSGKYKGSVLEKILDFIQLPVYLKQLADESKVTTVLAHGAPAGALAYKLWTSTRIPFYVSSFEPHADYMVESGVWKKEGLKYMLQTYWERKQKQLAEGLMPVAENFTQKLLLEGVPATKLFTVPCSVDLGLFRFNSCIRNSIREKYSWQQYTIGIYAGKFGGLYYDDEAFYIFQECFELIPDFFLILLSPDDKVGIRRRLTGQNIKESSVFIHTVPHQEVPMYLAAADFAFAPFKPGESKNHLSPVKVGEYWANGLPVLLTEGIGDDSVIIQEEGGGALFNLQQEGSLAKAILEIKSILDNKEHRQAIPNLAKKYRSPDKLEEAYKYFFGNKVTSI